MALLSVDEFDASSDTEEVPPSLSDLSLQRGQCAVASHYCFTPIFYVLIRPHESSRLSPSGFSFAIRAESRPGRRRLLCLSCLVWLPSSSPVRPSRFPVASIWSGGHADLFG